MSLAQIRNEIMSYADQFVDVVIHSFTIEKGIGPAWNKGEEGTFRVRVHNRGDMDIKKLTLHIQTTEHGKIGYPFPIPIDWKDSLRKVYKMDIPAHRSKDVGGFIKFKAKKPTEGPEEVLSVHVESFDLTWDHLLVDHTGHEYSVRDTHELVIYPN